MGKVKKTGDYSSTHLSLISIPYGKGKVMEHHKNGWTIQYQFPVGKVKKGKVYRKRKGARKAIKVSIPYGKGKGIFMLVDGLLELYQFPMGKVKNNILCCSFSIHHKYSFVNCFYAFQLFHH